MKTDSMLDAQLESLVGHIRREQSRRLDTVLDAARLSSRGVVTQAHQEARRAVHRAIERGRAAVREAAARSRAATSTAHRLERQRQSQALLGQAWPVLDKAVRERWQRADSRRAWWRQALSQAAKILIGRDWVIEHPTDWRESERREALELSQQLGAAACELRADETIDYGLRIRAGVTCCDCTAAGLLGDRFRIEADLGHLIGEALGQSVGDLPRAR